MNMKLVSVSISILFLSLSVFAIPKGFEDPELLERVMGGEIVLTTVIDTNQEGKVIARSYFNKVSPEAYLNLAVDYPRYPELQEMIKQGELLSVNKEKSIFNYRLDILVTYGLFSRHIYPDMRHTWEAGKSVHDESMLKNELMNYKKDVQFATENIRLIPYQSGMLVEDVIHAKATKASPYAAMAKKKLMEIFIEITTNMRTALNGNP